LGELVEIRTLLSKQSSIGLGSILAGAILLGSVGLLEANQNQNQNQKKKEKEKELR